VRLWGRGHGRLRRDRRGASGTGAPSAGPPAHDPARRARRLRLRAGRVRRYRRASPWTGDGVLGNNGLSGRYGRRTCAPDRFNAVQRTPRRLTDTGLPQNNTHTLLPVPRDAPPQGGAFRLGGGVDGRGRRLVAWPGRSG